MYLLKAIFWFRASVYSFGQKYTQVWSVGLNSSDDNVRILAYLSSRYRALNFPLIFPISHVRMAERSKAPDSRVKLFLTGVFWSTNVGVGSNPTSDKRFSVSANQMRNRAA